MLFEAPDFVKSTLQRLAVQGETECESTLSTATGLQSSKMEFMHFLRRSTLSSHLLFSPLKMVQMRGT